MSTVLVVLAPGFEEIEALSVVDILRRGGVHVLVAGLVDGPIPGRSGIRVLPDLHLADVDVDTLDALVLPGGMPGAKHLREDARVADICRTLHSKGRLLAAICAAPTVLATLGLLAGKRATSFPGVRNELVGVEYCEERVVCDGNIVTSRAPGTALEFALVLLERLEGRETMERVNAGVMARV